MSNKYKKFFKNVFLFLMNIFPTFLVNFVLCMWWFTVIKVQPLTLVSNIVLNILFAVIFICTITCLAFLEIKGVFKGLKK